MSAGRDALVELARSDVFGAFLERQQRTSAQASSVRVEIPAAPHGTIVRAEDCSCARCRAALRWFR